MKQLDQEELINVDSSKYVTSQIHNSIQYKPNNQNDQQFFYRIVLLLDEVLRKQTDFTIFFKWLPIICRSLLKLLKSINELIDRHDFLKDVQLNEEVQQLFEIFKVFYRDLFERLDNLFKFMFML